MHITAQEFVYNIKKYCLKRKVKFYNNNQKITIATLNNLLCLAKHNSRFPINQAIFLITQNMPDTKIKCCGSGF
jgi:hypothetical protein